MMVTKLKTPISDDEILSLKMGDTVHLTGMMITGRDTVHKWVADNFIHPTGAVSPEDQAVFDAIKPILAGGIIYHCGPVVGGLATKEAIVIRKPVREIWFGLRRREPGDGGSGGLAGHCRVGRNQRW